MTEQILHRSAAQNYKFTCRREIEHIHHKNTMKNIRSAIYRHIRDLERTRDIVKDGEFRISNDTSNGKLKQNVTSLKLLLSKTPPLYPITAQKKQWVMWIKNSGIPINQWKSINSPNVCATFTEMHNVNKDTQHTA